MKIGHQRMATTERLREELIPLIDGWQSVNATHLLARGYIARSIASTLHVTRQAASQHISRAVNSGELIEIFPRPDWFIELPGGEDIPPLYAAQEEPGWVTYQLQYDRPLSRGAGQTSFVITPKSLEILLPLLRQHLGLPDPGPKKLQVYKPTEDRMIRPTTHRNLVKALIAASPEKLTASQANDILSRMLPVLRLKAPMIPEQGENAER